MNINTSALQGPMLNFATAIALGARWSDDKYLTWPTEPPTFSVVPPDYENDWARCGPIFDEEGIWFAQSTYPDLGSVFAYVGDGRAALLAQTLSGTFGDTRCSAGLRCLVQLKLGNTVDIPDAFAQAHAVPATTSRPKG